MFHFGRALRRAGAFIGAATVIGSLGVAVPSTAAHATFSGDNSGWVAFTQSGNGQSDLAVQRDPQDYDTCGNFGCSVPINDFAGLTRDAAWSPDGTQLAFDTNYDGNYEIWVSDAVGENARQLTNTAASIVNADPTWSPDGSKIVFDSTRDGNAEIYTMNAADGSNVTRLTTNTVSDTDPKFSPDGSKIAFDTTRSGNSDIYVMNADGSNQTALVATSYGEQNPDWSPDGTKLVYWRDHTTGGAAFYSVFIVNATGTGNVEVYDSTSDDLFYPVFSPDGTRIAYAARDLSLSVDSYIRTMKVDGTDSRFIAGALGTGVSMTRPNWQPVNGGPGGGTTDHLLPGSALQLKDNAISTKRAMSAKTTDVSLQGIGDPRTTTTSLRLKVGTYDTTFQLPASSWRAIGRTAVTQYKYSDTKGVNGPITSVIVNVSKGSLQVSGKGSALVSLATNPGSAGLTLSNGSSRYCMSFGGKVTYLAGKTFSASKAPAPAMCTP